MKILIAPVMNQSDPPYRRLTSIHRQKQVDFGMFKKGVDVRIQELSTFPDKGGEPSMAGLYKFSREGGRTVPGPERFQP